MSERWIKFSRILSKDVCIQNEFFVKTVRWKLRSILEKYHHKCVLNFGHEKWTKNAHLSMRRQVSHFPKIKYTYFAILLTLFSQLKDVCIQNEFFVKTVRWKLRSILEKYLLIFFFQSRGNEIRNWNPFL
jgi:hypothetical protein